jgi:hypothetical protein
MASFDLLHGPKMAPERPGTVTKCRRDRVFVAMMGGRLELGRSLEPCLPFAEKNQEIALLEADGWIRVRHDLTVGAPQCKGKRRAARIR